MVDIEKTSQRIKEHLTQLTITIGERSVRLPDNLERTANYIAGEWFLYHLFSLHNKLHLINKSFFHLGRRINMIHDILSIFKKDLHIKTHVPLAFNISYKKRGIHKEIKELFKI